MHQTKASNLISDVATRDFVKNHEASLEYFCRFGTPIEQIKAELLLKIAAGVSL
jgi:hypothetical protein